MSSSSTITHVSGPDGRWNYTRIPAVNRSKFLGGVPNLDGKFLTNDNDDPYDFRYTDLKRPARLPPYGDHRGGFTFAGPEAERIFLRR